MAVDLSVIIVSYNVKPFLEQALCTVKKAIEGLSAEVFVVDNGSGDGSVQLVRERFPWVRLLANDTNLGFARANNMAILRARGRFICLLNPDTLVREDTFRVSLDYIKNHPRVGAVGCKILNPDGSLQLACRRSFPTPWTAFTKVTGLSALFPGSRLFGRYNLTYMDPDQEVEVDALSGSFMMVRKEAIREVGLLDEQFFLYGEDLDWCFRIQEKGWKIVYIPHTRIIHYKGQSTREAPFDSLRVFYGAMRIFVKKHFHKGWSFLPQWFLILGIWIRGGVGFLSRLAGRAVMPFVDLVFLQLALLLGILIRFGNLDYWPRYRIVNVIYTVVWLVSLYLMGVYKKGRYSSSRALTGVFVGIVVNTSLTFFLPQYAFSRYVILVTGILNAIFLSGWRLTIRLVSRVRRFPFLGTVGKTLLRRRVLIVGKGRAGREIASRLESRVDGGYDVVGFLGTREQDLTAAPRSSAPVLGLLKDIRRVAITHKVQEVIFSPDSTSYQHIMNTVAELSDLHLEIKMVPKNMDVIIGKTSIDSLEEIPLVDLDYRIYYGYNRLIKRAGDLISSLLILVSHLPVFLFMALHPGIRWEIRSFSDGKGGCFRIHLPFLKDRQVKGWAGRLPLFWAVLRGRMSLVGAELIPCEGGREPAGYRPGLTGLIQVSRGQSSENYDEQNINLYYLKNYSILLDCEILLRSVFRF
jgi:GT2 family glycosyltransferase